MTRLRTIIVGVACLLAWPVAPPRPAAQTPPPDLVLVNGQILTVDAAFSRAEAVAIRDGRFVAVGSNAAVRKLAGPSTRVVDLAGRTAVPGFADNHLHSAGGGPGVDLSRARSLDDVLGAIRARVAESRPGDVIVTNSDWHEAQLREQRLPLRRDLDRVAPANPVVVVRGGHEYILNSAALERWRITEKTPDIPGGRISRYPDGALNGELVDSAKSLVKLPPSPPRDRETRIRDRIAEYNTLHAAGLTSVRHPGISPDEYRLLEEMRRRGVLTMRVSALLRPDRDLDAGAVAAMLEGSGIAPDAGDEWVRVAGVKLAVDGGFEGGFMREPYEEPYGESGRYRGIQTVPPERFTAIVKALNRSGWRVWTHAVGDAAIDQVLDGYEAAHAERSLVGKRWGVEHAFIARPDHFPRMKKMGLGVSAQNHLYLAGPSLVKYWGRDRAALTTPMRAFLDAGIPVSSGTDAAVVPYPPLWTIYHFVTRDTITGGVLGTGQRITRQEALRLSTRAPAWLTFEEDVKGSIEPGKLADLVVLSDDILTCPEKRIEQMDVLMTIAGGRVVYERSNAW